MKIRKYVHATVELEMGDKKILIDPGKYNFGGGRFDLDYLSKDYFNKVDMILLSHTHADHYDGDIISEIYKKCNPKIISNEEVGKDLKDRNIEHIVLNVGEHTKIDNIDIRAVSCDHIIPCIGFLINDGKQSAYFVADSVYQKPDLKADVLFVPIGNRNLVMSPEEAARFTSELNPKLVIPVHYESPKDFATPDDFLNAVDKVKCRVPVKVMEYKEQIVF